jgi:DNA-binding IclR family transcriptional regulator
MLTVSRSVDRVFQIMELFSVKRRPLSATEIRHALGMPHSSAVSVLSRLVDLGYLDQSGETKRFFPSLRLHRLCESVPEAVLAGDPLARLADSVQSQTDETTSISRLDGLFTLPIYVRCATHARALRVIPGFAGGLATHSVVGRTLLSMLTDEEVRRFLERASYWAKRARVATIPDPQQMLRTIEFVRAHGYLCTDSLLLEGVGAVSCPLPLQHAGARLAITVGGPSEHIERRSSQLIGTVLREVKAFVQSLPPVSPRSEVTLVAAQPAPGPRLDSAAAMAL